jgi:pimeloyl-ACP methyl ester carboxylesterase
MRGNGHATSRQAVALAQLAETIPHSQIMTFPKLGHFAPEKKPAKITDALLRFFAAHTQPDADATPEARQRRLP